MKIEKLLTLSQLVEYIDTLSYKQLCNEQGKFPAMMTYSTKYFLILKYNELLKHPLTKEMFVNEIKKPKENNSSFHDMKYDSVYNDWQEAEKKVIFKGWYKKITTDFEDNKKEFYTNDTYIYSFKTKRLESKPDKNGNYHYWHNIETIEDLSSCIELELKNVEL